MNTCKKCNNPFSNRIEINGKIKNISKRKFCIRCSPFGKHNTKNLNRPNPITNKNGIFYKKCTSCNNILEHTTENFCFRKDGRSFNRCRSCERKRNFGGRHNIKLQCIKYKGGKCICCGYDKYHGSLDFHHTNPNKKDFSVSRFKSLDFNEKLKQELDKCVLVCKNCHGEIHGGVIILSGADTRTRTEN